jgi:lysozyme family protein
MFVPVARVAEVMATAKRLTTTKLRYQAAEKNTGAPWYLIACLHERESGADFNTYLGNGDLLSRPTRNVPAGRGPFGSWEAGAADALKYDGLTLVQDWRLEKILYYAERFNGWGYANRSLPSPYVWGATSIQVRGKYVSDGQWSSAAWDMQIGVAAMLAAMTHLDASVRPVREG